MGEVMERKVTQAGQNAGAGVLDAEPQQTPPGTRLMLSIWHIVHYRHAHRVIYLMTIKDLLPAKEMSSYVAYFGAPSDLYVEI